MRSDLGEIVCTAVTETPWEVEVVGAAYQSCWHFQHCQEAEHDYAQFKNQHAMRILSGLCIDLDKASVT